MSKNNFVANAENLALKYGFECWYDPKDEMYVVKTGSGVTVKNIDLREAIEVALEWAEKDAS